MAKPGTQRLSADDVATMRDQITKLETMAGYAPSNPRITVENIKLLAVKMEATQQTFVRAEQAAKEAREAMIAAQWDLRDAIIGAKAHTASHFGRDSAEVAALGSKRLSERKRPVRKKKNGNGDGKTNGDAPEGSSPTR